MKRTAIAYGMLAAVLVSAAASCAPHTDPPRVAPGDPSEILVSASWLANRLTDADVVVLHVARDRSHFTEGSVPGARFVRLGDILVERDGVPNLLPDPDSLRAVFEAAGVRDGSRVVVYGDLNGLAATRTLFSLEYLGHRSVALLDGGIEAWRADGHTVRQGDPEPAERGRITTPIRPEIVVDADWVRARLDDPGYALLDARPEAHYRGTDGGDPARYPRWGHIPGAGNVFWMETLAEGERPVHLDARVLAEMFRSAGAVPGRTVVAYCGTGVQASHAYVTARLLGLPAKLYDGSFIDWSPRDPDRYPVARIEE